MIFSIKPQIFELKCVFSYFRLKTHITLLLPVYVHSWEQRKVGDLLIERNQQAPMSDEYPLMAFIANEGVAPKGDRYDRSALVTDTANKLYKKTEIGDFIYSSNNLETGSIGLNKYGKACISPVYSIFEPTGIADSDFLGRRLVRKDFINAMVKWRQGVIYGQWRIHESDFLKIEIPVPSVVEQRKIGAYLDQLDRLITLHQRKCQIDGCRFQSPLAITWEQRKLGEVAKYRNGKAHENCIDESGKYIVVNSKFVSTNGTVIKHSNMQNEPLAQNEIAFVLSDVPNGRAIARTFLVEENDKYTLNQRIAGITSSENTYPYFLHILMNRHPYFLAFDDGVKQTNLSVSDVLNFETYYPEYEEQKQIGEYFRNLDRLITLHQCE